MTPLQQAAQELVNRIAELGAWSLDWPEYTALEKALEAEQAQAVVPDAIGCKCSVCGGWQRWTPSGMVCKQGHGGVPGVNTRLFTHPAPPATGERADLITHLRNHSSKLGNRAADMLEADAQDAFTVGLACQPKQQGLSLDLLERLSKTLINLGYSTPEGGMEHFGARIESQLYNLCRGVDSILAQQVAVPAWVPIQKHPNESSREAFESWCKLSGHSTSPDHEDKLLYWYAETSAAWDAWQASRAEQAVEPVAVFDIAVTEKMAVIDYDCTKHNLKSGDKLYNRPTPPAQQVAVPEGYALVPIEPTPMMLSAFHAAVNVWMKEIGEDADIYKAMLTAAQGAKP